MDFKKNQKHPDWLTVLVSCVISEWLCHLQWTWTSYWWLLNGNLFERHSLEILATHTHTHANTPMHVYTQTSRGRETKSKLITVTDGQVDAETFWSDRMDQVSSTDPFWLFCISHCLATLRCTPGITIFLLLVFLHNVCLSCLTGQINRSNSRNS